MDEVKAKPRFVTAQRSQMEFIPSSVDDLVPEDHSVRSIWDLVCRLDLSAFEQRVSARADTPGRPATDPRILLTLWVFAISEGVGSARTLAELCERDVAYRWICGGVSTNHHTLSDFRTGAAEAIDQLLTQVIGALMNRGIVTLKRLAQDGTRVRASAGAASFRRKKSIQKCLREAKKQVEQLAKELESDNAGSSRRVAAAKTRAARERVERLEGALKDLKVLKEERERIEPKGGERVVKRGEVRVSTTDKDARVMKMPDGGFRPAMNVQLAVDVGTGLIVGAGVTSSGGDARHVEPMVADILNRTGTLPADYLVDGGYVGLANIKGLAMAGVKTYAPAPPPKKEGVDRYSVRRDDGPLIAEWRQRMATADAKEIYKQRASAVERVNADLKAHRGMTSFNVRGLAKVTAVVLLHALTFNLLRIVADRLM